MTHSQTSAGRSARITENTTEISLEVNGITRRLAVDPRTSLLDLLRERLGLTGTKKGCDHGQCGACTVLIDGRRANACLALAVAPMATAVTTVEGLAARRGETAPAPGGLHPPRRVPVRLLHAGPALLGGRDARRARAECHHRRPRADPALTPGEIRERMSGNLCRCGAYVNIVRAITRRGRGHEGLHLRPGAGRAERRGAVPARRRLPRRRDEPGRPDARWGSQLLISVVDVTRLPYDQVEPTADGGLRDRRGRYATATWPPIRWSARATRCWPGRC